MDLNWLETFLAAAEQENFRRAAEKLHLTQPTVTMHIQKLEQELGVQLFERVARHVILSPAGRRYLSHAKAVVDAYRASRSDLNRFIQGYEETIVIAVSPLVATTLLPRFIRGFAASHPHIGFSIQVVESKDMLDRVLQFECDIALSRLDVSHPEVQVTKLYSDPVIMIAPAGPEEWEGPAKTVDEWMAASTVFTHNHPEYWDELAAQLLRTFPGIHTMQISQVHVTLHFISEGLGISLLPASTVRRELLRGTVMEVPFHHFPLPVAHTCLIRHQAASATADEFARYITEYVTVRE